MIAVAAMLGAGVGLGAWIAVRSLLVTQPPLDELFEEHDNGMRRSWSPHARETPTPTSSLEQMVGKAAERLLQILGADVSRREVELGLTGRTSTRYAVDKLVGVTGAVGLCVVLSFVLATLNVGPPPAGLMVLTIGSGIAGWLLPDVTLRDAAKTRRRAFRHALSAYLDLVNVIIAGGGGTTTALYRAAEAGEGWAFDAIRHALDRARLTGQSEWAAFASLAEELDIAELAELAASVELTGKQGAHIRESLAAKADTLRGHQIAETETAAESATERMTIPVAVLLFGFLIFVAYPAVLQITTVTGPPTP